MIKEMKVLERTLDRVVVEVEIKKRKLAKDKMMRVDQNRVAMLLLEREQLDVSSMNCTKSEVLCNYVEPPVLSAFSAS